MGDIAVKCLRCEQPLIVEGFAAGFEVLCPKCGVGRTVPAVAIEGDGVPSEQSERAVPEFAVVDPPGGDEYRYAAFISYRHTEPDRRWAKWLHSRLETYRVPRRLAAERGFPPKLGRIFRDEDELPASADLSAEIERALLQSRFLIVICSPRTPLSLWVREEIRRFRELGRDSKIIAWLIEGEPVEAFPPELHEIRRVGMDQEGRSCEIVEQVEPLAADVRADVRVGTASEQRRRALVKVLAGILGCPFDDLWRRERIRRKKEVAVRMALTVCLILIAGLLVYYANTQRGLARQHAREASSRGHDAEEWAQRYSEAYGEKADASRLKAVSDALSNPPSPLDETPVEWAPLNEMRAAQAREKRAATLRDLPEFSLNELMENLLPSPMQQADPRQPIIVKRDVPDRFILTGELAAVRVVGTQTFIYIQAPREQIDYRSRRTSFGEVSRIGIAPPVCIIFEGSLVADSMLDYSTRQRIRAAVKRTAWGEFEKPNDSKGAQPTAARAQFSSPQTAEAVLLSECRVFFGWGARQEAQPVVYRCFRGEGLERANEPATWIDSEFGAAREPSNLAVVARSLGILYRSVPKSNGIRGVLRAKYESARQRDGRLSLFLTIPKSSEGLLHIELEMGSDARMDEFLDYKAGDLVETDVTLTGLSAVAGHYFDSSGPLADVRQFAMRNRITPSVDKVRDPQMWDPLQMWDRFGAKCRWIRREGRPESLVLAYGPRRKTLPPIEAGPITPDMTLARPDQTLGKEVTWIGVLYDFSEADGETHVALRVENSGFGIAYCEAVTQEAGFITKLADYVCQKKTGAAAADKVSVTGTVRSADGVKFRIEKDSPLIELKAIQRLDDPRSLAVVGQLRDPDTIQRLTPEMARSSPANTLQSKVTWTGQLEKISRVNGETHILVKAGSSVSFEAVSSEADFLGKLSDYVAKNFDKKNRPEDHF